MCARAMSTVKSQQNANVLDLTLLKYIMQISNQTTKKLQVAIAAPILIENSVLCSLLTQEEMDVIKNVFPSDGSTTSFYKNKINSKHQSHSSGSVFLQNSNVSSSTVGSENSNNTDINFPEAAVFKMLKILYSYPRIHEMAEHHQANISTQSSLFKHHFHYFMEFVISLMHMTPEEENNRNMYFKKIWNGHKNALKEIKVLTLNLQTLREIKEKEMESVITQYKNDTTIIDRLNRKCVEDMQNLSNKYERQQYLLHKNWEAKREELRITLEKIKMDFEMFKDKNLKTTLNLDNKRVKVEAQLLGLISVFDTEMDIRQAEFDELTETYESDAMEKKSIKEAIKLQDSMYNLFLKDQQDSSEGYLGEASGFLPG